MAGRQAGRQAGSEGEVMAPAGTFANAGAQPSLIEHQINQKQRQERQQQERRPIRPTLCTRQPMMPSGSTAATSASATWCRCSLPSSSASAARQMQQGGLSPPVSAAPLHGASTATETASGWPGAVTAFPTEPTPQYGWRSSEQRCEGDRVGRQSGKKAGARRHGFEGTQVGGEAGQEAQQPSAVGQQGS